MSAAAKEKISKGNKGKIRTPEMRRHLSEINKGKTIPPEVREKIRLSQIGKCRRGSGFTTPDDVKIKISCSLRGIKIEDFDGFVVDGNEKLRRGNRYVEWRNSVFKRDDWTCLNCRSRNGNGKTVYLQADHIMPLSMFPQFTYCRWNGRTLCIDCHRKTHTYAKRPVQLLRGPDVA